MCSLSVTTLYIATMYIHVHVYTHCTTPSRVMYRGICVSVLKCVVTIYYWVTCSSSLGYLHTRNMYTHLNTCYLNEWVSPAIVWEFFGYRRNFIFNYYRYFQNLLSSGLTDGNTFKASFSGMCSRWTTWSPQWRPMPFIFSKRQADSWRTVNITNRHRIALRRDAIIVDLVADSSSSLLQGVYILWTCVKLIGHSACAQSRCHQVSNIGMGLSVCVLSYCMA